MMSGHATVDTAVEATRIGAVDFLEKPITLQKLLKTIAAGLARPVVTPAAVAAARAEQIESPAQQAPRAPQAAPAASEPADAAPAANNSLLGSISLDQPLRDARDEFERIYFEYHLGRENHSMTRVSEKTGLERTHLYRKLKQLGIDSSRRKQSSNQ
jgi:DNA-binding NtrC family response regulator